MYKRSKLSKSILPYLALFLTTTIWAVSGPIIKLTLAYVPPFTFLMLRFTIICTVLLPYLYFELPRHKIDPKDYKNIFILGLFGQASLAILFFGLQLTSAIDASIIATINPILIFIAGYYFFGEKITRQEKLGLLLATVGNLVVTLEPLLTNISNGHNVGQRVFGNILVLAFQLTWPAYVILGKRMMGQKSSNLNKVFHFFHLHDMHDKYHPMILTSLTFYVGLMVMVPFSLWEAYRGNFATINQTSVLGILYMAFISSIVAYGLFQWGIKKVEASESALFVYLAPILTLLPAKILLNESPSKFALYGMVIIALGVVIAEKYRN